MRDLNRIIVHHTGSRILRGFDSPLLVKARHLFRGFGDTGYHYLIGNGVLTEDGRIYETRAIEKPGIHTAGYNSDSVGIALIGNFDYTKPSERQMDSLILLICRLVTEHRIPMNEIYVHKEINPKTACPGKNFDIEDFRGRVVFELMPKNYRDFED